MFLYQQLINMSYISDPAYSEGIRPGKARAGEEVAHVGPVDQLHGHPSRRGQLVGGIV